MLLVPGSTKHNLLLSFCQREALADVFPSMCLEASLVAIPANAPLDTQA